MLYGITAIAYSMHALVTTEEIVIACAQQLQPTHWLVLNRESRFVGELTKFVVSKLKYIARFQIHGYSNSHTI